MIVTGYLASLLMGLAVGAAYGLAQVRSPAPPLIALAGLLGMVLGQQAIDAARDHSASTTPPVRQASGDAEKPLGPASHRMPK